MFFEFVGFCVCLVIAVGTLALIVCSLIERAVRRVQINALHNYRRNRAHVRWMIRSRAKLEKYRRKAGIVTE